MRLLSPSTTLTLTSSVSPGWKSGISLSAESFVICSFSSCWIRFMGESLRRQRHIPAGAQSCGLYGSGVLLRQSPTFVTCAGRNRSGSWISGLFGLLVGRPQVRPPLLCQPFGLGAPPRRHPGMVARGQDLRDDVAFKSVGSCVLRVFEQPLGKTLVSARGL